MSDRWSLGVLIGLPIAGLIALALLVALVLATGAWWSGRDSVDGNDVPISAPLGVFAALLVTVLLTGWFMWPWSTEYHRWHTTTGTVTAVSSRFLASDTSGGGSTQRFVVELKGLGERACDDTRCALVKPGDHLTLSCKRAWQYAGEHGYDCAYVEDHR